MEKTEWFPFDVLPVHNGLYETRIEGSTESAWSVYKDGIWHWATCEDDVSECIERAENGFISFWQDREWRGMTEPAK